MDISVVVLICMTVTLIATVIWKPIGEHTLKLCAILAVIFAMLFVATCPTVKDSLTIAIWGVFNALAGWVIGKDVKIQTESKSPQSNGKKD